MDSITRRKFMIALGIMTVLYIYHSAKPFALFDNLKMLCGLGSSNSEAAAVPTEETENFENSQTESDEQPQEVTEEPSNNKNPSDPFPKSQLSPGELLPEQGNNKWAASVPNGQGDLGDQNFLTAGYHVGVNTVGQTLRNANRQIRSEPPNPQVKVSPWQQSTIGADTNRRPLEIGGCE
tara:strand:+ start:20415 stop:20951 length:537 start_codon:yes stop_codon:yes gene_type:complete